MAVALRVAGTRADATGAGASPSYPAGILADDIILLHAFFHEGTTTTTGSWNTPTGFTLLRKQNLTVGGAKKGELAVFWKRAVGGESGVVSVTRSGGTGNGTVSTANMTVWSGCTTTGNPYINDTSVADETPPYTITITTTAVDRHLVAWIFGNDNLSSTGADANWTDVITAYTDPTGADYAGYVAQRYAATATGYSGSWSQSAGVEGVVMAIALIPVAAQTFNKSFSGGITPTAARTKLTAQRTTGGVIPAGAGTFSKVIAKAFEGSFAAGGGTPNPAHSQFQIGANAAGNTVVQATLPSAPTAGRNLVALVTWRDTSGTASDSLTPPSGWNEITAAAVDIEDVTGSGNYIRARAYEKIAGASEPNPVQFSISATRQATLVVYEFYDANGGTLVRQGTHVASGVDSSPSVSSGVRSSDAQYLLGIITHRNIPTITFTGDFTEDGRNATSGGANNERVRTLAGHIISSDTTSKTMSATLGSSWAWVAYIFDYGLASTPGIAGALTLATGPKTKSLSGAVTPTGVQVRKLQRLFPGTVTQAGALVRKAAKAFTGSVSSAGTFTKLRIPRPLVLAGSVALAGAISRRSLRQFLASVASSGSLVRRPNKVFPGSIASSGAVSVQRLAVSFQRSFTGTLASSGTLTRRSLKSLSGVVTSAGSFTRVVSRIQSLTGTVTSGGTLTRSSPRTYVGSVSSAGVVTFIKLRVRAFVGTVGSSSVLVRSVRRTYVGTITSAGTLTRKTLRTFVAAVTSAGVLTTARGVVSRTFSGSIASAGVLTRQARRTFTGLLVPSGNLLRYTTRALGGVVTSTGTLIRRVQKTFTGTVTSGGALAVERLQNVISRTFTGAVISVGTLQRRTGKSLQGTLSSNGVLVQSALRRFAGTIASTGSVTVERIVVSVQRAFTGAIGSVGTLTRRTTHLFNGTVASVGDVAQSVRRILTGTITSTGVLQRRTTRTFLGTVTSAGSLANNLLEGLIKRTFTGTIGTAGVVQRRLNKSLQGTLSSSAVVRRLVTRRFVGTVNATGAAIIERSALVKEVVISGIISIEGTLTRRAQRRMTGAVALVGTLRRDASRSFAGFVIPTGRVFKGVSIAFVGAVDLAGELTTQFIAKLLEAPHYIRTQSSRLMASAVKTMSESPVMTSLRGALRSVRGAKSDPYDND